MSLAEVEAEAAGGSIGRPHVARVLVRRGLATTHRDAFDRCSGPPGPPGLTRPRSTPSRSSRPSTPPAAWCHSLTRGSSAAATSANSAALVEELAGQGMGGLETLHSTHDADTVQQLTRLADRLGLVPTGGSDYHGPHKPWVKLGLAGGRPVPRSVYEGVRRRIDARPAGDTIAPSQPRWS